MDIGNLSSNLVCELRGHTNDVNCCAWSPISSQLLCSCGGDATFRVWDVSKGTAQQRATPTGTSGKPAPSPALVKTVKAHDYYINSIAFNPSGDVLATASSDNTVKLWSTTTWTEIAQLLSHSEGVRCCVFSPDGNLLATCSDDTNVKVWEVGSTKCIATLTKNIEGVASCCFAPNGWILLTGSTAGELLVFNAFSGKCLVRKLGAHDMGIDGIANDPFQLVSHSQSADVQKFGFASCGRDGMVKLWTVDCSSTNQESASVTLIVKLAGHDGPVHSCHFHPTKRLLASASTDHSVIIWNLNTQTQALKFQAHARYVTHVSFSPSGLYLVTASNDRLIKVWSLTGKRHRWTNDASDTATTGQVQAAATESSLPSLIAEETSWSVEGVCKWAEKVAQQQKKGQRLHPDDVNAVERLGMAVGQVSPAAATQTTAEWANRPGSDVLKCPITCEVLKDPVVAADGYSYERSAITEWFSKGRRTSPVTNLPLTNTLLLPNRALRMVIEQQK